MGKDKIYTGYAVVEREILDDKIYKRGRFGVRLKDRDLEHCKKYCPKGYIVVQTYRAIGSFGLAIRWSVKYPYFGLYLRRSGIYPKYIQLWHLSIELEKQYTDEFEREIIYEKED